MSTTEITMGKLKIWASTKNKERYTKTMQLCEKNLGVVCPNLSDSIKS